nr:hypothetical protein BaRGS_020065 [Batillaria attramentaria]
MGFSKCLPVALLLICLAYLTQAAPAPATAGENQFKADIGSDLKQLSAVAPPSGNDHDLFKANDDESASEDLESLSDPYYYEGYDDKDFEEEDEEEDNGDEEEGEDDDDDDDDYGDDDEEEEDEEEEEDYEEEYNDYEAEQSLISEEDHRNPAAVLDNDRQVSENSVTWRTQTPPSYKDDYEDQDDRSPFEKRGPHEKVSSELREGPKDFSRNRWRAREGKDRPSVPAYPPIRVIELNETLYLNHTDDSQPEFQPVSMPDTFEDYDVNRNGWISLAELRFVTKATEGATEAFRAADVNGDGRVDRQEFERSMWGAQVDQPPPQGIVLLPAEELRPSSNPRNSDGPKAP